jgi:hypothetical protein
MENIIRTFRSAKEPCDNVVKMPVENGLSDQDIVNLFMGLVRLVRRQYQSQIDALQGKIDELTAVASCKI